MPILSQYGSEVTVEVRVEDLKTLASELHKDHLPKFPDCPHDACTTLWFMLPDDLEEWTP
jgi:hypothetical protein